MDITTNTTEASDAGQETRSERSSSSSSSSSSSFSSASSLASTSPPKPPITAGSSKKANKMTRHGEGESSLQNVDDEPSVLKGEPPRACVDYLSGSLQRQPFSVVVGDWFVQLEELFMETVDGGSGSCMAHGALFVLRREDEAKASGMDVYVKRVLEQLQSRLALVKATERKSQVVVILGTERSDVATDLLRRLFNLAAAKKKQAKSVADEKMSKYLGKMGMYGTKGKTNLLANRKKKKKQSIQTPPPTPIEASTGGSVRGGVEKLLDDLNAMRRMLRTFTQFDPVSSACFRFIKLHIDNAGVVTGASLEHTLRTVGNLEALEVFDSAKRAQVSALMTRAGCSDEDVEAVWQYLEATLALLQVRFKSEASSTTTTVANGSKPDLARFAEITGLDVVELQRCLCCRQVRAGNRSSFIWVSLSPKQAHSGVRGLAMALFEALLEYVEAKANHFLSLYDPKASLTHGVTLFEPARDHVERMSDLERLLVNYANEELVSRTSKVFAASENAQLDSMGLAALHVDFDWSSVTGAIRTKHKGLEDALNEHTTLLNVGSRAMRALGKRLCDVSDSYPEVVSVLKSGEYEFTIKHWRGEVKYDYSQMIERNAQSVRAEAAQLLSTCAHSDLLRQVFERSATYRRTFVAVDDGDRTGGREGGVGQRTRRRDANTFLKRFVSEVDQCMKVVDAMDVHCVYSLSGEEDRKQGLRQLGFNRFSHKGTRSFTRILTVADLTQVASQSADEVLKSVGLHPNEYVLSSTHCVMTDTAYNSWLTWHSQRSERASIRIQSTFRRFLVCQRLRRENQLYSQHSSSATTIQAIIRMKRDQRAYKQTLVSTRRIQAWYRGRAAHSRFNARRNAVACMRKAWNCHALHRVVHERVRARRAVVVQKVIRRWLARSRMVKMKASVVIIQAACRRAIVLKRVKEKRESVEAYRAALDDGELSCWDCKVVLGAGKGSTVGTMVLTTRHRVLVLDEAGQRSFVSDSGAALAWAVAGKDEVYLKAKETGSFMKTRFKNPLDAVNFVQVIAEEHRPIDCLRLRKPRPLEREKPWMVFGQCPGRFTHKELTRKRLKTRMSSMRLRMGKAKKDAAQELPTQCLVEWHNTALIFRKLRPRRVLLAFGVNHDLGLSFNNGKLRFVSICPGMMVDEVVIDCDATSAVMLFEWARARIAHRRKELDLKDSFIELACLSGDTALTCGRLDDALWWYAKTLKLAEKELNYHTMESDSPIFYKMVQLTKRSSIQALSKRAKCKLRLGAAKGALADASNALAMHDANLEALWVKTKASLQLKDYPAAMKAACAALAKRFRHLAFQKLLHEVFLTATHGGEGLKNGVLCKRLGIVNVSVCSADVPFWSAAKHWLSFQEGDEVKELFRFGNNMAYGQSGGHFGFYALNYVDRS